MVKEHSYFHQQGAVKASLIDNQLYQDFRCKSASIQLILDKNVTNQHLICFILSKKRKKRKEMMTREICKKQFHLPLTSR